ncbi:MAG: glutamate formimidoyltransferase [Myxococcales bacterium]|jgi:glutamate formiminotransferase/formiminotetrahydrofolate cyclodeaminase|nr:glutamate formimidoyltransferase [Myxococcales bacterium]
MKQIIECVPNFSEGKRPEVIDQIVLAITSVPGVTLLDREADANHNRAVITFVCSPAEIVEAAFRGAQKAQALIDLTVHQGEHPRMGAMDVCPLIPIESVTIDECVALAKQLAKRLSDELGIPTYLYELAATRPDRVDLAAVRKGQFEGLRDEVKVNPNRAPDFGKPELHPTAGATAVGVRAPLVAYNINLTTPDVSIAKKIAKAIRGRDGGFKYAKAMGFFIEEKGCAQVSMNLTNYEGTGLHRVFEFVRREALRYGVGIKESEIIGLVPEQALMDVALWNLQLDTFDRAQILERRIAEAQKATAMAQHRCFIDKVAEPTPTPGGGSVAAKSGALGCALCEMVAGLTEQKKGFEAVRDQMIDLKSKFTALRNELQALVARDAASFDAVMDAFKLPKETDAQKSARTEAIQAATKHACEIPLETMTRAAKALVLAKELADKGNPNSITDLGVAALQLDAAIRGARLNVEINLGSIKDTAWVEAKKAELDRIEKASLANRQAIEASVQEKMG